MLGHPVGCPRNGLIWLYWAILGKLRVEARKSAIGGKEFGVQVRSSSASSADGGLDERGIRALRIRSTNVGLGHLGSAQDGALRCSVTNLSWNKYLSLINLYSHPFTFFSFRFLLVVLEKLGIVDAIDGFGLDGAGGDEAFQHQE